MDSWTWLSLGLQLAALVSIAGALLLYLLRKVKGTECTTLKQSRTVLVTSVDTALGLQVATYLNSKGWRVIAGCKSGGLGERLATSWATSQVFDEPEEEEKPHPKLATVELDVAREDMLEEAVRATTQHLPASEHGLWAVINTAGVCDARGAEGWENTLRTNVLGAMRLARMFAPLLAGRPGHTLAGRLFYIGLTADSDSARDESSVGFAASRHASCGAGGALRSLLRPIHVTILHAPQVSGAQLYGPPLLVSSPQESRPSSPSSASSVTVSVTSSAAEYVANALPPAALATIHDALVATNPKQEYSLKDKPDSWFGRMPALRTAH